MAVKEIAAGRGGAPNKLPPPERKGLVQQAALWNIEYLMAHHLNFGPVYTTSAEDLSITTYFDMEPIPYLFYGGIGVRKQMTWADDEGAARLNVARRRLAAWFAYAESAVTPAGANPPPPIQVDPRNPNDGGVQTIANYIVNRVLPNSALNAQAQNAAVQATAKSQAVEQITCKALEVGFITPAARTATFQINGPAGNQAVQRIDLP